MKVSSNPAEQMQLLSLQSSQAPLSQDVKTTLVEAAGPRKLSLSRNIDGQIGRAHV